MDRGETFPPTKRTERVKSIFDSDDSDDNSDKGFSPSKDDDDEDLRKQIDEVCLNLSNEEEKLSAGAATSSQDADAHQGEKVKDLNILTPTFTMNEVRGAKSSYETEVSEAEGKPDLLPSLRGDEAETADVLFDCDPSDVGEFSASSIEVCELNPSLNKVDVETLTHASKDDVGESEQYQEHSKEMVGTSREDHNLTSDENVKKDYLEKGTATFRSGDKYEHAEKLHVEESKKDEVTQYMLEEKDKRNNLLVQEMSTNSSTFKDKVASDASELIETKEAFESSEKAEIEMKNVGNEDTIDTQSEPFMSNSSEKEETECQQMDDKPLQLEEEDVQQLQHLEDPEKIMQEEKLFSEDRMEDNEEKRSESSPGKNKPTIDECDIDMPEEKCDDEIEIVKRSVELSNKEDMEVDSVECGKETSENMFIDYRSLKVGKETSNSQCITDQLFEGNNDNGSLKSHDTFFDEVRDSHPVTDAPTTSTTDFTEKEEDSAKDDISGHSFNEENDNMPSVPSETTVVQDTELDVVDEKIEDSASEHIQDAVVQDAKLYFEDEKLENDNEVTSTPYNADVKENENEEKDEDLLRSPRKDTELANLNDVWNTVNIFQGPKLVPLSEVQTEVENIPDKATEKVFHESDDDSGTDMNDKVHAAESKQLLQDTLEKKELSLEEDMDTDELATHVAKETTCSPWEAMKNGSLFEDVQMMQDQSPEYLSADRLKRRKVRVEDIFTDSEGEDTEKHLLKLKQLSQNLTEQAKEDTTIVKKARRKRERATSINLPAIMLAFEKGWIREVVFRSPSGVGTKKADIYYYSPDQRKLRSRVELEEYLEKNNITDLSMQNFSFFKEPLGVERKYELIRQVSAPIKHEKGDLAGGQINQEKLGHDKVPMKPVSKKRVRKLTPKVQDQPAAKKQKTKEAVKKVMVKDASGKGLSPSQTKKRVAPQSSKIYYPAPSSDSAVYATHLFPANPPLTQARIITPVIRGEVKDKTFHCTATCEAGGGNVPNLQCVKCVCLFHPECCQMPPQTVSLILSAIAKFLCPNCYREENVNRSSFVSRFSPAPCFEPLAFDPVSESEDEGMVSDYEHPNFKRFTGRPPTPEMSPLSSLDTTNKFSSIRSSNLNLPLLSQTQSSIPPSPVYPQHVSQIIPNIPLAVPLNPSSSIGPNSFLIYQPITSKNQNVSQQRYLPPVATLPPSQMPPTIISQNLLPLPKAPEPRKESPKKPTLEPKIAHAVTGGENFLKEMASSYLLVRRIFSYLSLSDFIQVSRVCLMWRDVAFKHPFWNCVRLRNICVSDWDKFVEFFDRRGTAEIDLRNMVIRPGMLYQRRKSLKYGDIHQNENFGSPTADQTMKEGGQFMVEDAGGSEIREKSLEISEEYKENEAKMLVDSEIVKDVTKADAEGMRESPKKMEENEAVERMEVDCVEEASKDALVKNCEKDLKEKAVEKETEELMIENEEEEKKVEKAIEELRLENEREEKMVDKEAEDKEMEETEDKRMEKETEEKTVERETEWSGVEKDEQNEEGEKEKEENIVEREKERKMEKEREEKRLEKERKEKLSYIVSSVLSEHDYFGRPRASSSSSESDSSSSCSSSTDSSDAGDTSLDTSEVHVPVNGPTSPGENLDPEDVEETSLAPEVEKPEVSPPVDHPLDRPLDRPLDHPLDNLPSSGPAEELPTPEVILSPRRSERKAKEGNKGQGHSPRGVRKISETLKEEERELTEEESIAREWRIIASFLGKMRSLRKLVIGTVNPSVAETILLKCHQLTSFSAFNLGCQSDDTVSFDPSLLMQTRHLEELRLTSQKRLTFKSNFNFIKLPHLKVLMLKGLKTKDIGWPYMGTQLTHLYLSSVSTFSHNNWLNLSSMRTLVELELDGGGSDHDSELCLALTKLSNLNKLSLFDWNIGPKLPYTLRKLHNIKYLNVVPASESQSMRGIYAGRLMVVLEAAKHLVEFSWGIQPQSISDDESAGDKVYILNMKGGKETGTIEGEEVRSIAIDSLKGFIRCRIPNTKITVRRVSSNPSNWIGNEWQ